ncbi:hypothetical protein Cgig2_001749 [Carnegiea gigantea]|uniref:Flavin-containing monooxygenase n=1 Tax=Carnegiea gigantea TaxID=171969 RepID=A0A9Q1QF18_9CARY|nr:hypothetical protein Cgig2_001749 [Carnegiea gigantea]
MSPGPKARKYMPKDDFVRYIDDYVEHFKIRPRYCHCVEFASFNEAKGKWQVEAKDTLSNAITIFISTFLVIATGENGKAVIPNIPGLEDFKGDVIHSSQYKCGSKYKDKKVLVVGCGNSGMEISYDLANYGANTSIVIRNPVLPGISRIFENSVLFEDQYEAHFDAIIFATGYKNTTCEWLKDYDYILNDNGYLKNRFPNHWKGKNRLYCAGLSRMGLLGVSNDAVAIVDDIQAILRDWAGRGMKF